MSGAETNGEVSKADAFRALTRQKVHLNCGLVIEIRKLTGLDWVPLGNLPLVTPEKGESAIEAAKRSVKANPEAHFKQIKMIIVQGVVSPRVVDAQPADVPDGALSIYDLPDQDEVAMAILRFSGLTEAAAKAAGPFSAVEVASTPGGDGGSVSRPAE